MVRPDKSPDADDAADRPTQSPLKTSKADGVGPARSLCCVFHWRTAGKNRVYQSLPRGTKTMGLHALFHVAAETPALTALTLPSPRPANITPV
jgi:hypothetical protein